ncbi:uncharacterized protein LOC111921438 [Lactuca sativa]|uniref:uncharacterized protein LOC111921438 n=1 Tax=Lactuca sativa TaxID=4236 RepID=UPI000CD8A0AE|nr:uncharacterized protein LOC111921438 [Lactuca sativa]
MSGGESSQPPVKEHISFTFQCPTLTLTNYTIWRMRMEVLLGIHGVWDVIDPGLDDVKKNNIVKRLLFQSILEDLILQIGNLKTGREMWEAIKTRNLGADRVKEARLQTLITKFENLKMSDNSTIDEFAAKRGWRLNAYEERIKGEDKVINSQNKLLYSKTESSNRNTDSSRGRGRGSNNRGRGRGGGRGGGRGRGNTKNHNHPESSKNRDDQKQKGKQREKRDLSNIQCYRCDKFGHFASRCPDRIKNHEANLNQTHEGDTYHEEGTFFMMNTIQETVFLNEDKYIPPKVEANADEDRIWYLDTGASNHMTRNYTYFSELNKNITGKVRFGDGSCVSIKGKGSILFEGKSGEQKLMKDIYYIPSLRSNVISLG